MLAVKESVVEDSPDAEAQSESVVEDVSAAAPEPVVEPETALVNETMTEEVDLDDEILDFVNEELEGESEEEPGETVEEMTAPIQEEVAGEELKAKNVNLAQALVPESKEEASAPKNQVLAEQFETKTGVVGEKSQAVSDIRKAISVMDRFLYMKELFGNSQDTFNDALDAINNSHNFQEAVDYLLQFNWEDNETSQQFMKLLTRRFS